MDQRYRYVLQTTCICVIILHPGELAKSIIIMLIMVFPLIIPIGATGIIIVNTYVIIIYTSQIILVDDGVRNTRLPLGDVFFQTLPWCSTVLVYTK